MFPTYSDFFKTISERPYSKSAKLAKNFIKKQISLHRLNGFKSYGLIRKMNYDEANRLEKNLGFSVKGNV